MQRISVFLSVPQYRALKQLSQQRGLTLAELIRRAIDHFLQTEKE
jgi:predicted DNA-binding protein